MENYSNKILQSFYEFTKITTNQYKKNISNQIAKILGTISYYSYFIYPDSYTENLILFFNNNNIKLMQKDNTILIIFNGFNLHDLIKTKDTKQLIRLFQQGSLDLQSCNEIINYLEQEITKNHIIKIHTVAASLGQKSQNIFLCKLQQTKPEIYNNLSNTNICFNPLLQPGLNSLLIFSGIILAILAAFAYYKTDNRNEIIEKIKYCVKQILEYLLYNTILQLSIFYTSSCLPGFLIYLAILYASNRKSQIKEILPIKAVLISINCIKIIAQIISNIDSLEKFKTQIVSAKTTFIESINSWDALLKLLLNVNAYILALHITTQLLMLCSDRIIYIINNKDFIFNIISWFDKYPKNTLYSEHNTNMIYNNQSQSFFKNAVLNHIEVFFYKFIEKNIQAFSAAKCALSIVCITLYINIWDSVLIILETLNLVYQSIKKVNNIFY